MVLLHDMGERMGEHTGEHTGERMGEHTGERMGEHTGSPLRCDIINIIDNGNHGNDNVVVVGANLCVRPYPCVRPCIRPITYSPCYVFALHNKRRETAARGIAFLHHPINIILSTVNHKSSC
jgi:hypothetical protein